MSQTENLKKWAEGLSEEQLKSILVICVEELIRTETVKFWNQTAPPYWDANGDNIDGTERTDNDA